MGGLTTEMSYGEPLGTVPGNTKAPFPAMLKVPVPLFCRTKPVPVSPTTTPPMVSVGVVLSWQAIAIEVTLAFAMVPAPFEERHVCVGVLGWDNTST